MASDDWRKEECHVDHNDVTSVGPYAPWINDDVSTPPPDPPANQLVAAAMEFARRFPYPSLDNDEMLSHSLWNNNESYLLVANRVRDDWDVPNDFDYHHPVRFMLMPTSDDTTTTTDTSSTTTMMLFIKCMPGPEHASYKSWITSDVEDYIAFHGLRFFLERVDSGGRMSGYDEPDVFYRAPTVARDRRHANLDADPRFQTPFARLIIEVECSHRTGYELRRVGFVQLMKSNYIRMFLAVRVWRKGADGTFGGAAVLWGKNEHDDKISVRKAVDFGTTSLNDVAKKGFELFDNNNKVLPRVETWIRPQPRRNYANLRSELDSFICCNVVGIRPQQDNPDWYMELPKADLFYKTSLAFTPDELPYLLQHAVGQALPECFIDLQTFAARVHHLDS